MEEKDETTTIRVPISWIKTGIKLSIMSAATSDIEENWKAISDFLSKYRGGLLRDSTGKYHIVLDLNFARRFLSGVRIEDVDKSQEKAIWELLKDGKLGDAIDITSSRGDTLHIRIVSRFKKRR